MKRILFLIKKELLTALKDKKIRISILLPPIIQLFVFTYAATLDVKNVPIGIINRDAGEKGFELVERFYGTKVFNQDIHFLKSTEEIAPFIDKQKGIMVLSIDETFSRRLDAGTSPEIQLIFDGRKTNTAQIVAGYASLIIQNFNNDVLLTAKIEPQKVSLVPRIWFNPNVEYLWYNIPCMVAILAMMICLVVTTQSVARERELGTFDQLLVSPLLPYEILIGKVVPGILIGLFEGLLMLFIGTLVLGVPFTGSYLLYFVSLFIFVTSISGIGLFISSVSATQQQAMLGSFVFMLPAVLLSGFATPIDNMPEGFRLVTYLIPLRYMLVISKGLFLKAISAKIVFSNLWPLILISVLNFIGAGVFFRRRIQ